MCFFESLVFVSKTCGAYVFRGPFVVVCFALLWLFVFLVSLFLLLVVLICRYQYVPEKKKSTTVITNNNTHNVVNTFNTLPIPVRITVQYQYRCQYQYGLLFVNTNTYVVLLLFVNTNTYYVLLSKRQNQCLVLQKGSISKAVVCQSNMTAL